jgi:leukotriene-A4 hydrolase
MVLTMRRILLIPLALALSCATPDEMATDTNDSRIDHHSYANFDDVAVKHVALDLDVDFEAKQLRGSATLALEGKSDSLVLDTKKLTISAIETSTDGESFTKAGYELGMADPVLGSPLTIATDGASHVRVHYATDPGATGLQWLDPNQTAGKKSPFLFTQSQAIHARTWIPLQDSPAVRATYSATIRTPNDVLAVMSAEMKSGTERGGEYHFEMPQAIPSYLIALAVGDLVFEPMSERTGIYAEPSIAKAAAAEFDDTEDMMLAVESLYGPYRWGRYDILVLPPSFPFGGMENPRLTFATPTVIAGDKSLVNLVAHELAHSWSGNLVTNATWRDFWLNEGFTVYLEERIQELVYGPERAAMETALEVEGLKEEMASLDERDEILHVELEGRDPDEGFTGVPYNKGAMFLRTMEKIVGREVFDPFLRGYFDNFAFQSITTADFVGYLSANLLDSHPEIAEQVDIEQWIEQPGIPEHHHEPVSDALDQVAAQAQAWLAKTAAVEALPTTGWTTQHWLHFLRSLPDELSPDRMAELDKAFQLTASGNSEILCEWLIMSVRNNYAAADHSLERFLTSVGRRKFLKPLYEELAKTAQGKQRGLDIYRKARPGYHPIYSNTVDGILGWTN